MNYSHILIAIDLSEESEQVIQKAVHLASLFPHCKLSMIHVTEPLSFAYGGDLPIDFSSIQEEITQKAQQRLYALGAQYGIDANCQYLRSGKTEKEIQQQARAIHADLIVIGTHGRNGFSLLLGSTSSGLLHGVERDVLAVRIKSD